MDNSNNYEAIAADNHHSYADALAAVPEHRGAERGVSSQSDAFADWLVGEDYEIVRIVG